MTAIPTFWHADLGTRSSKQESGEYPDDERQQVERFDQANLIGSLWTDGRHRPTLDIDIPLQYVPSTTPGHGHLTFPTVSLSWDEYKDLLEVLGNVGILEPGYVAAALRREATFVRPPWVRKPAECVFVQVGVEPF